MTYLEVMERNAVGHDLGGEEGDAGDDQQQRVQRRAALEQGSPEKIIEDLDKGPFFNFDNRICY